MDIGFDEQITMFDLLMPTFKIDKPIRLIELFGGIGAQAMALRDIGANFEHYRLVEFDKYPVASYNAIHGTDFKPTDIRDIHGVDLGIEDVEHFIYLLTYLLFSVPRFERGGAYARNEKRKWYKVRAFVGSRKTS